MCKDMCAADMCEGQRATFRSPVIVFLFPLSDLDIKHGLLVVWQVVCPTEPYCQPGEPVFTQVCAGEMG